MLLFFVLATACSVTESAEEPPPAPVLHINVFNYFCSTLYVDPFDPPCSLFDEVVAKCPRIQSPNDISIIFNGKIILNLIKDHRTIHDIGITEQMNGIQIIQKPVFAALLEMVVDIDNIQNIPWFNQKIQCLSDSSAKECQRTSEFERGLHYDVSGDLVGIDLSHLNLTGTIHLKLLPQSVKSLDLSFNNLLMLKFGGLEHKSLERLNVEHNDRLRINDTYLRCMNPLNGSTRSRMLLLSSNQIFQSANDLKTKYSQIRRWLHRQQMFEELVVNKKTFHRKNSVPFYVAMLNVIEGVTNKGLVPWYRKFTDGKSIRLAEWHRLGISRSGWQDSMQTGGKSVRHCSRDYTTRYSVNLRGLALEGHIDVGSLPRNVKKLDLSNNNLSSISFVGDGPNQLRELNLQSNNRLRIKLEEFNESSILLPNLNRLLISSNQLVNIESAGSQPPEIVVRQWLRTTLLDELVLDDVKIVRIQDPVY